jgi:hypothetical protein
MPAILDPSHSSKTTLQRRRILRESVIIDAGGRWLEIPLSLTATFFL